MKMVMNRNITVSDTSGHAIAFKKGVPCHVPSGLVNSVRLKGGVPAKGEAVPEEDEDKDVVVAPVGEERTTMLREAFAVLMARNTRGDFNAHGVPKIPAIKALFPHPLDAKEVANQWKDFKAALKAEV